MGTGGRKLSGTWGKSKQCIYAVVAAAGRPQHPALTDNTQQSGLAKQSAEPSGYRNNSGRQYRISLWLNKPVPLAAAPQ